MQDPLVLAERILTLRSELATAEADFRARIGGPRPAKEPKLVAAAPAAGPTAQRVRSLLQASGKPTSFGDIMSALGDAKTEAVKSALKKAREGGTVGFRGFKYYWK